MGDARDPYLQREQFTDVHARLAAWLGDEGLGREVNARAWDYLLDHPALLRSVRNDPKTNLATLSQEYAIALKHLTRRGGSPQKTATVESDARSRALDEIAACGAEYYLLSRGKFRNRHLPDGLIAPEAIPSWIEEQARLDRPPAHLYHSIPTVLDHPPERHEGKDRVAAYARWLEEEARRVASNPGAEVPCGRSSSAQLLSYASPGQTPRVVGVRCDGALALLRAEAAGIVGVASVTGWQEHEAVAFILSGAVPRREKAWAHIDATCTSYPALTRITLQVDPRMTPQQVAQLYGSLRKGYSQGRDRPMSEKHLALAVFTEQTRFSGESWAQLRTQWNADHRKWRFAVRDDPFARRFGLECRTAWSRVTGAKWLSLPKPANANGKTRPAGSNTDDRDTTP